MTARRSTQQQQATSDNMFIRGVARYRNILAIWGMVMSCPAYSDTYTLSSGGAGVVTIPDNGIMSAMSGIWYRNYYPTGSVSQCTTVTSNTGNTLRMPATLPASYIDDTNGISFSFLPQNNGELRFFDLQYNDPYGYYFFTPLYQSYSMWQMNPNIYSILSGRIRGPWFTQRWIRVGTTSVSHTSGDILSQSVYSANGCAVTPIPTIITNWASKDAVVQSGTVSAGVPIVTTPTIKSAGYLTAQTSHSTATGSYTYTLKTVINGTLVNTNTFTLNVTNPCTVSVSSSSYKIAPGNTLPITVNTRSCAPFTSQIISNGNKQDSRGLILVETAQGEVGRLTSVGCNESGGGVYANGVINSQTSENITIPTTVCLTSGLLPGEYAGKFIVRVIPK